jgi:hypothetical protein
MHAQLRQNVVDVNAHGGHADAHFRGDLPRGKTARDQQRELRFAWRESAVRRGVGLTAAEGRVRQGPGVILAHRLPGGPGSGERFLTQLAPGLREPQGDSPRVTRPGNGAERGPHMGSRRGQAYRLSRPASRRTPRDTLQRPTQTKALTGVCRVLNGRAECGPGLAELALIEQHMTQLRIEDHRRQA